MSNASSKALAAVPEPKRVPKSPLLAILFVVVVYYISQVFGGVIISTYPVLKHWSHAQAVSWADHSVIVQFLFTLLVEAFTVAAVYALLRYYKRGWASIGLRRPRWRDPAYALAVFPAYFLIFFISIQAVSALFHTFNVNQQQQIGFNGAHGSAQLILTFVSLVILPPIAEEIIFRGLLYTSLKKALRIVPAALITSAIFAIAHLPEGGAAGPLYIAALDTFVLSLVLVYLREKTGSLWASITLHGLKNGVAFVVIFVAHVR